MVYRVGSGRVRVGVTETLFVSRTRLYRYECGAVPLQCAIRLRKISRHGIDRNIDVLNGYELAVPGNHRLLIWRERGFAQEIPNFALFVATHIQMT